MGEGEAREALAVGEVGVPLLGLGVREIRAAPGLRAAGCFRGDVWPPGLRMEGWRSGVGSVEGVVKSSSSRPLALSTVRCVWSLMVAALDNTEDAVDYCWLEFEP